MNLLKFFGATFVTIALLTTARGATTPTTWTGAVSTDWGTADNWSPASVPTSSIDVVIPTLPSGGRFPTISSGVLSVDRVDIRSGATVTQTGGTITMRDLLIAAGGVYSQQGGHINFDHDWRNNGTFTATAGTVQFTGDPGSGGGGFLGVNQFFNVIVDAGIDPRFDRNLGAATSIAGNFVNYNTKLDNNTHLTVTFNGTGDQFIYSASANATFGNLVVDKDSGTLALTSTLVIAGDAIIDDGTVNLGTNLLTRKDYGGTLALNGDSVLYVGGPSPSNFATVTVGPNATLQNFELIRLAIAPVGGSCRISGTGTPGRTYRLQCADALSGANWQDVSGGSLTADSAGCFQCLDAPTAPLRFYRAVYP
jgi:hypothetical protein